MPAGREIVEGGLLFPGGLQPVIQARFFLQAAHYLNFSVSLQIGGPRAIHGGASGKHVPFGSALGRDLFAVSAQILRLDRSAETLPAPREQLALERGGTSLGGGMFFLRSHVSMHRRAEGFAGFQFLVRAKEGDGPKRKTESFHGSRVLRVWNVWARVICSDTD